MHSFGNLLSKKREQKTLSLPHDKRTCAKCGQVKTLDVDNFQAVKHFKTGFSYYCNECNKPKPKPKDQ